jgi:heme A synthase
MARALTFVTLALTIAMMMLGAVVHGTGSSLACPDWPWCYGSAFPRMEGGVLFEHSHRLLGTLIGLCVIALNISVIRGRKLDPDAKRFTLVASALIALHAFMVGTGVSKSIWPLALVGLLINIPLIVLAARAAKRGPVAPVWTLAILHLVIIQGTLGGLTVVLKLPVMVSSAHLGLSMIILSLLVALSVHLAPPSTARPVAISRTLLGTTIAFLFMQIVVGALVKHTGASLACGVDVLMCNGTAPHGGPAHLHFTHRIFAFITLALVIASTVPIIKAAKAVGNKRVRMLALAAHGIVLTQVALGVVTVLTYIAVASTALHLGVGALLLADLVMLFATIGAQPAEHSTENAGGALPTYAT